MTYIRSECQEFFGYDTATFLSEFIFWAVGLIFRWLSFGGDLSIFLFWTHFLAKFWGKIHHPNFFNFRCLYILTTVVSEIDT